MEKPSFIYELVNAGFNVEFCKFAAIWGQGDGWYWRYRLTRGKDLIVCDRDITNMEIHYNGRIVSESVLLTLVSSESNQKMFSGLFIGKFDKNKTKIHEGDIIKFRANYTHAERCGHHEGVIVYNNEEARFNIKVDGYEREFDIVNETGDWSSKTEVIGSIHKK